MKARSSSLLSIVLLLGAATFGHCATLLTINDLQRPGGGSANTFITGTEYANAPTTANLTTTPAGLTFVAKTGTLVSYFNPFALDTVGKAISFQFTGTFSDFNNASGGFRVGLFDSASLLTADVGSSGNFAGATGYGVVTRAAASANDGQIFRRASATANILSPADGTVFTSAVNSLGSVNGTSQTGSLTLERTAADTLRVTWQFAGQAAIMVNDVGPGIATTFDTVAFYFTNSIGGTAVGSQLQFTEYTVTAVPEPSHALLVAGLLAGAFWWRRR